MKEFTAIHRSDFRILTSILYSAEAPVAMLKIVDCTMQLSF
jgi:hypothetical protein